jgi:hypothetical protein
MTVTGSGALDELLGITLARTGMKRRAKAAMRAPTRRSVLFMGPPYARAEVGTAIA